ncbi:MAG TPA: DUF4387 domain-containing protein [Trueperaceae bacterium]|nr:DUF4387 domain-containing protein [Trueperaceae bacterium]
MSDAARPSKPATRRLTDLAKTVRSKNAGVDKITFDIIFSDRGNYELVKNSNVLNRQFVSQLYGVAESRITDFVTYDPAYAIKFTILRERPSGSPGDSDIFGAQQYAPLLDVEIPVG